MPKIKVSEILELSNRINKFNQLALEDIEFIDDDEKTIEIDHEIIDDFRFMGLNNLSFITTEFYKKGFSSEQL